MTATDITPADGGDQAGDVALDATDELTDGSAERGFSRSIVISGIRCTLTYVILPFVAPWIGLAPGVGPTVGLAIGVVAIAANLFSIRRFWAADHKWKVQATILHVSVLVLLTILMVLDINQLVG
jgi:hypothetical protein